MIEFFSVKYLFSKTSDFVLLRPNVGFYGIDVIHESRLIYLKIKKVEIYRADSKQDGVKQGG